MIDILNKHFQDSLHINKQQSGLVQFANYLAYFLMAIPAGLIARKFGYKGGILVGLVLIAGGAFWFIHAVNIGTYSAFLLGLFVIAAGMTCLETIANPYTTVLGPPENGATRINIAQTFNGVGWILGPIVGGYFVFSGGDRDNSNAGLSTPYLGIGIFAAVLLVFFTISQVPDLHAEDESKEIRRTRQTASNLPAASWRASARPGGCVGLLYFFIAPILGLVWALLNFATEACSHPTKYGLIVAAYVASFILVAKNWDMFRRKHFTLGIVAQFLYVAAQTGIFSFCVNYILENDPGSDPAQASHGWVPSVLCCSRRTPLRQCRHQPVQAASGAGGLCGHQCGAGGGCMGGGIVGLYAMFGTFFFMSVMFPTIFALGIRGLGDYTKLGSSLIVMSIVGGAIAAPFMGHIADVHSMRPGLLCRWSALRSSLFMVRRGPDSAGWIRCLARASDAFLTTTKLGRILMTSHQLHSSVLNRCFPQHSVVFSTSLLHAQSATAPTASEDPASIDQI